MIIAREVKYIEVYDVDLSKYTTIRDDLDFCQRLLWVGDPVLVQEKVHGVFGGIKLLSKHLDCISKNPIYPVPDCYL